MPVGIRSVLAAGRICKTLLLGVVTIAMVFPGGNVALGQSSIGSSPYTFASFDVPNSIETNAFGINGSGQIVGYFISTFNTAGAFCGTNPMPAGCVHGFLKDAGGTPTTIDGPNSGFTQAFGINDAGQIVGNFVDASNKQHGFLRAVGGTFTTIDFPNSIQTVAFGINSTGQIVGYFYDSAIIAHGFLRDAGGTLTRFDVNAPGTSVRDTFAYGINGLGQIVGEFNPTNPSFNPHGFLRDAGGTFTTFDVQNATFTRAFGINGPGQIVGNFSDASGGHGFLRDVGGTFTKIDLLGALATAPNGINGTGQIAGFSFDTLNKRHGFLASPGKTDPRLPVAKWFQAGIPGAMDSKNRLYPQPDGTFRNGNFWGPTIPQLYAPTPRRA